MRRPDRDSLLVREASDEDAEALAECSELAWRQSRPGASGFAGATDEAIPELTTRGAFVQRIGGPDRRRLLVLTGERIIGFAATRPSDPVTVELAGIIVLPSHAGRGAGTALVSEVVRAARDGGCRSIVV